MVSVRGDLLLSTTHTPIDSLHGVIVYEAPHEIDIGPAVISVVPQFNAPVQVEAREVHEPSISMPPLQFQSQLPFVKGLAE